MAMQMRPILPKRQPAPSRTAIMSELTRAVQDTVSDGNANIARYPAQTLTQTGYRRTNTLKRSWNQKVTSFFNRIVGTVFSNANIAPYNRWVQGPRGTQVAMFAGASWLNVTDLAKSMRKDLAKNGRAAMRRLARRRR